MSAELSFSGDIGDSGFDIAVGAIVVAGVTSPAPPVRSPRKGIGVCGTLAGVSMGFGYPWGLAAGVPDGLFHEPIRRGDLTAGEQASEVGCCPGGRPRPPVGLQPRRQGGGAAGRIGAYSGDHDRSQRGVEPGQALLTAVRRGATKSNVPLTVAAYAANGSSGAKLTYHFLSLADLNAESHRLAASGQGGIGVTVDRDAHGWNFTASTANSLITPTASSGAATAPSPRRSTRRSPLRSSSNSPERRRRTTPRRVTHSATASTFMWSLSSTQAGADLQASTTYVGNQANVQLATALTHVASASKSTGSSGGSGWSAGMVALVAGGAVIVLGAGAYLVVRRRRTVPRRPRRPKRTDRPRRTAVADPLSPRRSMAPHVREDAPMKIVSLLPSATEIVFALGLGDQLEGVSFECDFPEAARHVTVVSGTALDVDRPRTSAEIDAEVSAMMAAGESIYSLDDALIRAIDPDVILVQDLCAVCAVPSGQVQDALDVIGCHADVVSLDPAGLDDVIECVAQVGRATGTEHTATEVAAALRQRCHRRARPAWPAAYARGSSSSNGPTHRSTVATGCRRWWRRPGASQSSRPMATPSRRLTWDEIAAESIDVTIFSPCGFELAGAVEQAASFIDRPDLPDLGRIVAVNANAYFSRPGPRVVDGVEMLAELLHPTRPGAPVPGAQILR